MGTSSSTDAEGLIKTLGGADEKFAFSRAVSRLCEMQSAAYLSRCRRPSGAISAPAVLLNVLPQSRSSLEL